MTSTKYAYARHVTDRFLPLPTESQVADLERRIGVGLPEDYREFLMEFNGGCFYDLDHLNPSLPPIDDCRRDALNFFYGIGASHETYEIGNDIDLFDDNDPPKIVPIGSTVFGSLIILDTAPGEGNGAIYFK